MLAVFSAVPVVICHCLIATVCNTRSHGLLKIVTMSGQCVICQVNVSDLGYN